MLDHIRSFLKSLNFYVFSHLVYHVYSGWKRSKFVYFGHVWPYLQWSEKNLNFYVQMVQEFVHYSCVVFCMWFNIHTVVGKGLNLCIFYMFDHTCSGLKKSKFLWVLHVVYCTYSGWKKSKFVYFWHVWPYLQWSEKVKILMGFCIWLTILTVVKTGLNFYGFLHVIYCTYSGWKRSKFVYFWHVWQYLQWSEKV